MEIRRIQELRMLPALSVKCDFGGMRRAFNDVTVTAKVLGVLSQTNDHDDLCGYVLFPLEASIYIIIIDMYH